LVGRIDHDRNTGSHGSDRGGSEAVGRAAPGSGEGAGRGADGPYLQRNRQILTLLEQGEGEAAEKELMGYLDDAEAELLTSAPSPP